MILNVKGAEIFFFNLPHSTQNKKVDTAVMNEVSK